MGWKQIVVGTLYTCALDTTGKVYCWGWNSNGQIGNNSSTDQPTPLDISSYGDLVGKTVAAITAGGGHTCALDTAGKAYCWGSNSDGQIGDNNSSTNQPTPLDISSYGDLVGKTVAAITAGGGHTCALDTAGKAYCWGFNNQYQIGNNFVIVQPTPLDISSYGDLAGKTIIAIKANAYNTCALDTAGKAYCWGRNDVSQIGNNSSINQQPPLDISGYGDLVGKTITSTVAGDFHTCALDTAGKAYCWGYNTDGQIGDNTSSTNRLVPTAVDTSSISGLNGKTVKAIVAGGLHTCALDTAGKAYCWGRNDHGQLGDNTTTDRLVPTPVNISSLPLAIPIITLDGLACTNLVVISNTELTCITPAHTAGLVDVVLTINGGTQALTNGYRYVAPPTITSIYPDSGPIAGGTEITINGTGFDQGGIVTVTINSSECTNVTVISDTELTCTTPAHIAGLTDVAIYVNGESINLPDAFEYVAGTGTDQTDSTVPGAPNTSAVTEFLSNSSFIALLIILSGSMAAMAWLFNKKLHKS